jgi:hypothetical protein
MVLLLETQRFSDGFEAFRCPDYAKLWIPFHRLASQPEFKYPNTIGGLKDA